METPNFKFDRLPIGRLLQHFAALFGFFVQTAWKQEPEEAVITI
jgi:hypothetical protein